VNGELHGRHTRKETQEMMAECFREAGTLVLVFVPIYGIIERTKAEVDWFVFWLAMVFGIALLLMGIEVERRR
jgi:hypothetical protein